MKKIVLFLLIALVLLVSCNQDEVHVHKFDEGTVTTAPTCTTEGVKTFKCQCGETKTEEVPALGHDKENVEAKEATCTEKGWKAYEKCKREGCDYSTYEEIAAKGHTEGTPVTTAATCTAAGSTVVKCTVCNEVISTTPIEKLEHTSNDGVVTTEPTCTEEGEKTFSCTVCNTVLSTEKVPATGHSYGDLKTTAATCEKDGEEYKVCSVCNYKNVERTLAKLGHNFKGTETVVQQATCTEKGSKTIKCTRCEKTTTEEIAAKGHTETSVTTAATCTAAGSTVVKCTVCNAVISETPIEKLGHTSNDGVITTEPTCTKEGEKTFSCTVCNTVLSTEKVDATGHSYGELKTTAATCEKDGEEYKVCSVCNYKNVERTLTKLNHDFKGTETVVQQATCTEKGSKTIKCTRCEKTTTEEIAATGHDFEETGTVKSEATCQAAKVVTYKCKNCTHTEDRSEGYKDSTNHVGDTEWKVATNTDEAKYFTEGTETEYCKACNTTTGNTRKYFKDLTGFWEGTANYNNTTMTFTFSFADGKLTTGSVMNGLYGEAEPYSYTVSSTGITTEGDKNPNFSFVSEDGEKITLSINSVNIELERKTTTAHTHTYKTGYEVVETTDDDGNITELSGHTHETNCTVHSVFKAYEMHNFSSGTCTVCGAKYYEIWKGDSTSKNVICYVRNGSTYTLLGDSTVIYTLNDSTTTYQGGASFMPTDNLFITDVAYSTLSNDDKSRYIVLSTYVAPSYTVGGTVEFGTLAGQPITWKVLSVDTANSRALVISENILEKRQFDADSENYSGSDIQAYLNGDFITTYGLDKSIMCNVDVTTAIETTTVGSGEDKVFLLSLTEVNTYFGTVPQDPSAYEDFEEFQAAQKQAQDKRVAKYDGTADYWWLRSKNANGWPYPAVITEEGYDSMTQETNSYGVRPAFWVNF